MQVPPYTIIDTSTERILVVKLEAMRRFKFKHLVDDTFQDVKLVKHGKTMIAKISKVKDSLAVYKLPNVNAFHYEYMTASRRSLWLNVAPPSDAMIVDNMLEFIEFK